MLGKLNLHEFAYGGSGIIGAFGITRNPWDTERITGGSSSGSAAAVAAGLCLGAIGTDTAGSIRLPSAFCGISGFKPTLGLVSAHGVIPLAPSYDHVGPMARTAEDCALMLDAIAAYDSWDPNSSTVQSGGYAQALADKTEKLRLGIPDQFFFDDLDPEVAAAFDEAYELRARWPLRLRVSQFPSTLIAPFMSTRRISITRSICRDRLTSINRKRCAGSWRERKSRADEYQEKKAELLELRRKAARIFDDVDLILTPTVPVLPPAIADLQAHPEQLRPAEIVMLRNTRPFNVLGLPSISIPCGFSKGWPSYWLADHRSSARRRPASSDSRTPSSKTTDWHKRIPLL